MKYIYLTSIIAILISCGNKKNDSNTSDSEITSINDTSAALPTPEEVVVSKTNPDEGVSDPVLDNSDFDYTYEGTINKNIKVKVNIFKYRGELKARAVYLNSKKIINMDAAYVRIGAFELIEKVKGKTTGIWKIEVAEEDIFTGIWTSPDNKKQMPISLSMTGGDDFDDFLAKDEIKTGFYQLKEINENAETKAEFPLTYSEELYVKNMAENTIYFDLYIQGPPPGVHMGMINGFAQKSMNSYIYKNENDCEISMTFSDDKVELKQVGNSMNCEFGANISAFGTLKKK